MNQTGNTAEVLKAAQTDHDIFYSASETFRSLFMGVNSPNATQHFDDIKRIMVEKLFGHFSYEEETVFPALLAANPNATVKQIVAELCLEHARLLGEGRLLGVLRRDQSSPQLTPELWLETLNFLENLEKHANKEEDLFKLFPK